MCRSLHETEQAAQRVRRWREETRQRTDEETSLREREAQYHAHRLMRQHPEVAEILAREIPSRLAADIIRHLKGGAAEQ